MQYYQFHIGDYMSSTAHLSLMEDLAYRRLIELYYRTEKPITCNCSANAMHMECIARSIRMRDHVDVVETVLKEFFVLSESGYINARCQNEIDRIAGVSKSRSEAAKCRWNANALQKECTTDANGMLPKTQDPRPKKEKNVCLDYPEQFDGLWKIYGMRGNKKKAGQQWDRLTEDQMDRVAESIQPYIQEQKELQYRMHFDRYLRDAEYDSVLERKAAGCLNVTQKNTITPREQAQIDQLFAEDGR